DPVVFAQSITEGELKEHLYTYASDGFEGRETGKPGQKKAIAYLKAHYESFEIPAAKEDGDYFQKVPLEISKVHTGSVSINGKEFQVGEELVTFSGAQGNFDQVTYAGYGVEEGS